MPSASTVANSSWRCTCATALATSLSEATTSTVPYTVPLGCVDERYSRGGIAAGGGLYDAGDGPARGERLLDHGEVADVEGADAAGVQAGHLVRGDEHDARIEAHARGA